MKFLVIRKRHLVLAAGAILALTIFCAVNSPPSVAASVAARQLPIYCVDRDNKQYISMQVDEKTYYHLVADSFRMYNFFSPIFISDREFRKDRTFPLFRG